jgi:hypothetical protein
MAATHPRVPPGGLPTAAVLIPQGPPQPAPSIAALKTRDSAIAQRWFSVALANATATTFRAPGAGPPDHLNNPGTYPATVAGWRTGAPVGYAVHCDDRPFHNTHLVSVAEDCSSQWNCPVVLPTGRTAATYKRRSCPNRSAPHGEGYLQCQYCRDHTTTEPWFTHIANRIDEIPQVVASPIAVSMGLAHPRQELLNPPAGTNQSTVWFTRLCTDCETDEQLVLDYRFERGITPAELELPNWRLMREHRVFAGPPQSVQVGWPYTTCICHSKLDGGPAGRMYCMRCTHDRACDDHDDRLVIRAQNDQWLRRIVRRRDGRIVAASAAQQQRRVDRGAIRACRCGKEVLWRDPLEASNIRAKGEEARHVRAGFGTAANDPATMGAVNAARMSDPEEVLLCLGCEGVRHLGRFVTQQGGRTPLAIFARCTDRLSTAQRNMIARANKGERDYPLRRL